MKKSINSRIRITSALRMIVPAIILAVLLAAALIIPFGQIFKPAEASSLTDILEVKESGDTYVHYSLDNLRYTGYDYYSGGEAAASYYYILEEKSSSRCLFFLLPVENTDGRDSLLYHYSASARLISDDKYFDTFLSDYCADIGWSYDGLREISGNFLVSDFNYHLAPYVVIFILMMLILLMCAIFVVVCLLRIIFPQLHPACRRLHKFGLDNSDFSDIENEISCGMLVNAGNMVVTEHYLVAFGRTDLWIVPLFNIVWVFEYSKWRRFRSKNKLVYTMNIVTSPKDKLSIRENTRKDINIIIEFLEENFSHITVGYTDEIRRKMNRLP